MPTGTNPAISGMTMASSRSPSSQLSSFLPRPPRGFGGVLFLQLSLPAAEHFAHQVYLCRKGYIFLIQQRAAFPEDQQQKLQRIQLARGKAYPRQFFILGEKRRARCSLYYFNKESVNFLAYRIAMDFREGRIILMPQQISLFDVLQNGQKIPAGGGSSKKGFRSYV